MAPSAISCTSAGGLPPAAEPFGFSYQQDRRLVEQVQDWEE